MTKKELVEILNRYPDDMRVMVSAEGYGTFGDPCVLQLQLAENYGGGHELEEEPFGALCLTGEDDTHAEVEHSADE